MTRLGPGLVAALAFVLAACGGGGSGDLGPIAIYPGSWNGNDASLSGTLRREDSCLYVVFREGPNAGNKDEPGYFDRYFVAFAADGTSWDEKRQAVKISRDMLTVGEHVRFGGGEVTPNYRTDWVRPPDPACDVSHVWLVGR